MLDVIKSYLSLEMTAKEFRAQIEVSDELVAFIAARLPASGDMTDPAWAVCPLNIRAFAHDGFDVRRTLVSGYYALTRATRCSTAYRMLYELFRTDLPELERSDYYREIGLLAIDAVPEALDSCDAGEVIFDIIASTKNLSGAKRKKAIREALAEAFHLGALSKKPAWIQASEWPLGAQGKPMRFVVQRKKGECVEYTFEDEDTHDIRVITQFY